MKKRIFGIINICLLLTMLMGCSINDKKAATHTLQTNGKSDNVSEEEISPATEDMAVVLSVDLENKIVSLQSVTTGEKLILVYTGGCDVRDRYDEIISMSQMEVGEIVDFSYVASKKKLYSMKVSDTAWEYKDVRNLQINQAENTMTIAKDKYQFSNMLVILSEEEKAMLMDINQEDTLILRGIGKQICSIVVDKGHGYVKLENSEYFIGGFVEVGQEVVKPVTENMLLVVPEGKYVLYISKNGVGGSKSITVNRNEEITVDVGDIKGTEIQKGSVKFKIIPEDAKLTIDGTPMEHKELLTLQYGSHKVRITAKGYKDYSGTLKVNEVLRELEIELESSEDEKEDDTTPTPVGSITPAPTEMPEGTTITPTATSGANKTPTVTPQVNIITEGEDGTENTIADEATENEQASATGTTSAGSGKIYITAPDGAEVYFDGNYVGLVPVSFKKTSGTHTITLSQEGYKTKSYTVYISDGSDDTTYTFSDMVANDN